MWTYTPFNIPVHMNRRSWLDKISWLKRINTGTNTLQAGQPRCSATQPVGNQTQIQRCRDPLFLRGEQGANTAQNGTGFKNVSCESAYGPLWELFLKWEEAVITSPSVAPCATEIIFILEVPFDMLSPFPRFSPPHSGRQTWGSLTSVVAVRGRKWGEVLHTPGKQGCPPITQAGTLSDSSWRTQREN